MKFNRNVPASNESLEDSPKYLEPMSVKERDQWLNKATLSNPVHYTVTCPFCRGTFRAKAFLQQQWSSEDGQNLLVAYGVDDSVIDLHLVTEHGVDVDTIGG